MKRIAYFILPLCLCACGEIELPDVKPTDTTNEETQYTKKFTFTVKGDFCNPSFVDDSGRMTRGNQYMTADGVEMTDLWVVDVKDGTIRQSMHQSNTDGDWGAPTMSLTLGTHHIYFLASRGQSPMYSDGVVTWSKPLDTFYLDYDVTVANTSNGNRAVTLERVATKFQVVVEDAIPNGTTAISLKPTKWSTGWNMLTASPVDGAYTGIFALSSSQWGANGLELNMWSLSGPDEWTTDIAITSKAGDTTNAEVTITDAPLKANRVTRFSGALYSTSGSSSVTLSSSWLPMYEGVF